MKRLSGCGVVVDPGHGGTDPGATRGELREADVVLDIAREVDRLLRGAGARVLMTRERDIELTLAERAYLANRYAADLFVSVHANAHDDHDARGFEVWTSRGQTAADTAADLVYEEIKKRFPYMVGRRDLSDGDSDKEAGFAVLVQTECPAVLVEVGFLTNPIEGGFMRLQLWRQRMARAIAAGVEEFLGG